MSEEKNRKPSVEETLALTRVTMALQEQIMRAAPELDLLIEGSFDRPPEGAAFETVGAAVHICLTIPRTASTRAEAIEQVQAALHQIFKQPEKL